MLEKGESKMAKAPLKKAPKYKGAPLAPKVAKVAKPKKKDKKKAGKWYPGKFAEKLGIGRKKKAKRLQKHYEKPGSLISEKVTGEERKKTAKRLAKEAAKDPKTGRVRKGAKGVESTSGGEYVKYAKKSKAAKSFRSEFAKARKAGKKAFTWDGRSYSTARADDKKKAAPKKAVKGKGKTFGKEGVKKAAIKATDVSGKRKIKTPIKDVMDTKDRLAKRGKYRDEPEAPVKKEIAPVDTTKQGGEYDKYNPEKMAGGGKVEGGGMFDWPTRDARNGGKK
jgi:hypothetical protein